jgi:hypothetical protein
LPSICRSTRIFARAFPGGTPRYRSPAARWRSRRRIASSGSSPSSMPTWSSIEDLILDSTTERLLDEAEG